VKIKTTIRKALTDPALLGHALKGDSWKAWRTLLIASMGETLTDEERVLFQELTHRDREPLQRVEEFVGVVGRRGGKSRAVSVLATYLAGLCEHPSLVAGETGVLLCIAPDREQAGIVLDYIEANFRKSKVLRQLIVSRTARALELRNGIEIRVKASDFRRLRGPSYIAVIADESAFWLNEGSSNPDSEILNSVRPGLATTGGPLFLISSPYARKGELWSIYNRHFGPKGDPTVLVAQGSTLTFNPGLRRSVVDRAYERDPIAAAAEFGAEFRTDIESFVSLEVVQACIKRGVYERPYQSGMRYVGFVDPSGGSADSFTLAIAHRDADSLILDCVREVRPPFSPESVCMEYAGLLKTYRITKVTGDRYAGEWPREQFRKYGVQYELSSKAKSDIYRDLLPLLNSRRVELIDNPKLVSQLVNLERRTSRGGRDSIDHPSHGHDDLANAAAGVLTSIAAPKSALGYYAVGPGGACQRDVATGNILRIGDPVTGEWRDVDRELSNREKNACIPGRSLDSDATLFNSQRGILSHPLRRQQ
jgi:hypothetical protein